MAQADHAHIMRVSSHRRRRTAPAHPLKAGQAPLAGRGEVKRQKRIRRISHGVHLRLTLGEAVTIENSRVRCAV